MKELNGRKAHFRDELYYEERQNLMLAKAQLLINFNKKTEELDARKARVLDELYNEERKNPVLVKTQILINVNKNGGIRCKIPNDC